MDITRNLTIVIPVRIDCDERKENLDTVIHSLLKTTNAYIIILEADVKREYFNKQIETTSRVEYHFVEDFNPIFHRTLYLNKLMAMAKTGIVGIWDTDVLISSNQILECVREIQSGVTLCYPYDGRFIFLDPTASKNAKADVFSFLNDKSNENLSSIMGRPLVGGAFIVNKMRYLKAGGENENFYGWGPEDAERFKRVEILEEPISRVKGALFHLHHPRFQNSMPDSSIREKENIRELIHICKMDKRALEDEIKTWHPGDMLLSKRRGMERTTTAKQPLVSVIMPVYNTAGYLERSIYSILNQTYSNLEFIIIDDGSTDGSLKLIEQIDDKRIKIIQNRHNVGNYVCRNQGMRVANGKYIAVMDSDDIAMPHRLEAQVQKMESDEKVIAVGTQFYSDYGLSNKPRSSEVIKVSLLGNNCMLHPSLMIRKDVISGIGGYDESYTFSSDYDLACNLALRGEIVNMPDILMKYSFRKDQISILNHSEQAVFANQIRLKYLSNIGFILAEIEGVVFTKAMNNQQLSASERSIYESTVNKLMDYNKEIGFFQSEVLELFLQEAVEHCRA